MSQAYEVDSYIGDSGTSIRRKLERAGSGKSLQPAVKIKGSVANEIKLVESGKSADPRMTEPQYGLPTDGVAGGPNGSQYEDAVGPSGSAASFRTVPQYGLPTDGGARGPSGSAEASSFSAGPPQALEGDNRRDRKKFRDQLRAEARKLKQRPPASYNPQGYLDVPPICNRIATPWSFQPAECQCEKAWPKFFAAGLMSGQITRTLSTPCYDGIMTIEPGKKPCASYRRPGGHLMKERWWYNAVLEGLANVTSKSGHTKTIAIVN